MCDQRGEPGKGQSQEKQHVQEVSAKDLLEKQGPVSCLVMVPDGHGGFKVDGQLICESIK